MLPYRGSRQEPAGQQFSFGGSGIRQTGCTGYFRPSEAGAASLGAGPEQVNLGGKPMHHGYRTKIREILQNAYFVIPKPEAFQEGLSTVNQIYRSWKPALRPRPGFCGSEKRRGLREN